MTEQTGVARDVRRRQLPAEHAAAMNDGRYTPQSGHLLATQYRLLRATFCRTQPQQKQQAISGVKSVTDLPVGA
jgi:hypothetical protein